MSRVGIVIPTIFERPEYLLEAIASIRAAGDAYILLSSPDKPDMVNKYLSLVDQHQIEIPSGNLAAKIDHALRQLPTDCDFIGWLGDDDLLTPGSLNRAEQFLKKNHGIGLVYGSCDYINQHGDKIGQNPSGSWAKTLMHFGPFLIPQPGAVWRRSAFEEIGGIDDGYELAFDYDLFLRLSKHSEFKFLGATQACFRWHEGSLSVRRRWASVMEASKVRRASYNLTIRPFMYIWEPLVIIATRIAGSFVSSSFRK